MKINVKKKAKPNPLDDNFMVLMPEEKKNNDVEMTDSKDENSLTNTTSDTKTSKADTTVG